MNGYRIPPPFISAVIIEAAVIASLLVPGRAPAQAPSGLSGCSPARLESNRQARGSVDVQRLARLPRVATRKF